MEASMWRDPLDELIDDLERAIPEARFDFHRVFLKQQQLTDAILYGTPEEVARLEADPVIQEDRRRYPVAREQSPTDRPAVSGPPSRDRR